MSKHLGVSGKEKLPYNARKLPKELAQGGVAICHDWLCVRGERQDEDMLWEMEQQK